jgi:hypothetical protein
MARALAERAIASRALPGLVCGSLKKKGSYWSTAHNFSPNSKQEPGPLITTWGAICETEWSVRQLDCRNTHTKWQRLDKQIAWVFHCLSKTEDLYWSPSTNYVKFHSKS